jgi:hypothetical protein
MTIQGPPRIETGGEAVALTRRIALVHRNLSARVEAAAEKRVMTFPHLIVREMIALEILLIGLGLISLLYDAPLESMANPNKTPNPAKAPWYFLGLQELLHYFPPVVAGVLIPMLAVAGLLIIPYFRINVVRDKLWREQAPAQLYAFASAALGITFILAWFKVWVALIPTLLIALLMISTFFRLERTPWHWLTRRASGSGSLPAAYAWLESLSLAAWVMTWFVTLAAVLTLVGTFFRGPGWSFVWPWQL